MSDTILRTIDLTKRYKDRLAVDHLNIEVRQGDVFGFLGPNGAGKSTTIRMILHLVFPTAGDVELFGTSLNRARHKALDKVGAVVEKPAFYGHLSALRNLEILGGLQKPVTRKRIMENLERVGLADRAGDPVKTYSHGMNQRLGLALILLATRMAIIHKGRLRATGSVRELLKQGPSSVLVRTDRPDEALRFLKAQESYASATTEDDGIAMDLDLEGIPELNRQLVGAGFNVNALVPRRSLETYFLNLIEGREA